MDEIREGYNRMSASFGEARRTRKALDTKNPWVADSDLEYQPGLSQALQNSILSASLSETAAADESVASPTIPANNQEFGSGVEENTSGGYETPEETC